MNINNYHAQHQSKQHLPYFCTTTAPSGKKLKQTLSPLGKRKPFSNQRLLPPVLAARSLIRHPGTGESPTNASDLRPLSPGHRGGRKHQLRREQGSNTWDSLHEGGCAASPRQGPLSWKQQLDPRLRTYAPRKSAGFQLEG